MDKLAFVFIALSVAAVYAAPDNFLACLKSLNHFKGAEALQKPLHTVNEQRKDRNKIELANYFRFRDNDNMLNVGELRAFLLMFGIPENKLDQYVSSLMVLDVDKNGKLDLKEMDGLAKLKPL